MSKPNYEKERGLLSAKIQQFSNAAVNRNKRLK
jgi:hypothetical protein